MSAEPPRPSPTSAERRANDPRYVVVGTALLLVLGLAILASLVNLWPSIERIVASTGKSTSSSPATVRLFFALVTVHVRPEAALLVLVVLAGALGSLIHTATSFSDFVGNQRYYSSWSIWYLLRPIVGAALATLIYFAVRGGFLSGSAQSNTVNPYGIGAVAGLAGLFSKQATDKLREVFETLFKVGEEAGDSQRRDELANPPPVLSSATPATLSAGAREVTLTLHGKHFIAGSTTARIAGAPQSATVITPNTMKVRVPDSLIAHPTTLVLTAVNGTPGGGESRPVSVPVIP
jgi:IPT/TIG domain